MDKLPLQLCLALVGIGMYLDRLIFYYHCGFRGLRNDVEI